MPLRDGTGPNGRGPLTGRGMGYCIVKKGETPIIRFADRPRGLGLGRGRGRRRGR